MRKRSGIRVVIWLFSLAGVFLAYQWFRNFIIDPDLGSFNSVDHIVAIELKKGGSHVVLFDPAGKKTEVPGYTPSTSERDVAWSTDGNRVFFVSDRDGGAFQAYRWNPGNGKVEPRTTGTRSKGGIQFQESGTPEEKRTALITSGGFVFNLNPKDGSIRQILPPTTGDAMMGEEQGVQGQFDGIYKKLGSSFREAMYGPDRSWIVATLRRDDGEVLIYQDLYSGDAPRVLVAGQKVDFDVSNDGKVAATVEGFTLLYDNPADLPKEFVKDGKLVLPFRHALFIYDLSTKPKLKEEVSQFGIFQSPDDAAVMVEPKFNYAGDLLLVQTGMIDDAGIFRCAGLSTIPPVPGGMSKINPLQLGDITDYDWSPDDSRVVFTVRTKGGNRDIWTIDSNGTNAKNLTNGSGSFAQPRFSPQKKKGE